MIGHSGHLEQAGVKLPLQVIEVQVLNIGAMSSGIRCRLSYVQHSPEAAGASTKTRFAQAGARLRRAEWLCVLNDR